MKLKQSKPFSVTIPASLKRDLQGMTDKDGIQRGIMFSTSGKALIEHVNPTAQYAYLFKTQP